MQQKQSISEQVPATSSSLMPESVFGTFVTAQSPLASSYGYVKRRKQRRFKRFLMKWLTVTLGAIATGICLGYLIVPLLLYVFDHTSNDSLPTTAPKEQQVAIQVAAKQYYFVQYGVFTQDKRLKTTMAKLQSKGLAASSLHLSNEYRVFVGMSTRLEDAIALKALLANEKLYLKKIDFPAMSSFSYGGEAADVKNFIEQSHHLLTLGQQSAVQQLLQTKVKPSDWPKEYDAWHSQLPTIKKNIASSQQLAYLQTFSNTMNDVSKQVQSLSSSSKPATVWHLQTLLMDAVFQLYWWLMSTN